MAELVACVTAGVGLVLLGLLVAAVRPHVRRFTTANAAWRASLARGTAAMAALSHRRGRAPTEADPDA